MSIAMALVGILVGAGFATGQEVIQYFITFGAIGIAGAVLAAVVLGLGGIIALKLGSYYLAEEHNEVFSGSTSKITSRILDVFIVATLFAMGFVMMAGAGSTLGQQFGVPNFIGSTAMLALVIGTGFLNVDKVMSVIGALTPLVIIMVIVAFIYAMMQLPLDMDTLNAAVADEPAPVSPWWLSALNYAGLALLMALSMVLVMGGNFLSPKEAGRGGLIGGIFYMVLLVMASVSLYTLAPEVIGTPVPNLEIFNHIGGRWAGIIVVWIVFLMIYNTCIALFYALGRRLAAKDQSRFHIWFIGATVAGYLISFVGFQELMGVVYPIIGYVGLVTIAVMTYVYLRDRSRIATESGRRATIRKLMYRKEHPDMEDLTAKQDAQLKQMMADSNVDTNDLRISVREEVAEDLAHDKDVDYEAPPTLESVKVIDSSAPVARKVDGESHS